MAINVNGTRNTLEVMRELGIPKGVYTSTVAVNSDTHGKLVDETYRYTGPHISAYDHTKWLAHYQVAEPMIAQGLPLVIVMPGAIYGPDDTSAIRTVIVDYLQRKLPMLPRVTAYSWGHVEDIARAHLLAMEKGTVGQSYIVAGPTHTLVEAMTLAQRVTGVPVPRQVSPEMLRALAAMMSIVEKVAPVPANYSAEYLRVAAGVTYIATSAKAQREWGYAPRPLEDGLPDTLRNEMRLLGMQAPVNR
jgi:nucleoside-diphosphate-sugar epimerase